MKKTADGTTTVSNRLKQPSVRTVAIRSLVCLVAFLPGIWSVASAASLTIKVEGIEKTEGVLMLRLVDSEEAFEGSSGGVASVQLKVTQSHHTFMIDGLTAGTYALRLMHDLNGNQELDTNLVGMPTEPYAFSNNAKANFGPPKFKAAAFEIVEGDNETTVTFAK